MSRESRHRGHDVKIAFLASGIGMLLLLFTAGTMVSASAVLIQPEDHWKYNVKWRWDPLLEKTTGLIISQIIIENETSDRIEGYIADVNGTRLAMYDGDQLAMVKYIDDRGFVSKWDMAATLYDGYFAFDIPPRYQDYETIRIYIGSHQYTVDDGTLKTPQSMVFINSARVDYRTNSTLDLVETTIASEPAIAHSSWSKSSPNSLIDFILGRR